MDIPICLNGSGVWISNYEYPIMVWVCLGYTNSVTSQSQSWVPALVSLTSTLCEFIDLDQCGVALQL